MKDSPKEKIFHPTISVLEEWQNFFGPDETDHQKNVVGPQWDCMILCRELTECIKSGKIIPENCLAIDRHRNAFLLSNVRYIWEIIEDFFKKLEPRLAIAEIIMNPLTQWEKRFPELVGLTIKKGSNYFFYVKVVSIDIMSSLLKYLSEKATNEIRIFFLQ